MGAEAAMQVVADGVKRQSLECQVTTLQWGPLKVLKERKVSSSEQDGRGEVGGCGRHLRQGTWGGGHLIRQGQRRDGARTRVNG